MASPKLRLLAMQREPANARCADCGACVPQWASLSFAVFLCLSCAGVHRELGVATSFVRSVSLDSWDDDQTSRMLRGGNARFARHVPPAMSSSSSTSPPPASPASPLVAPTITPAAIRARYLSPAATAYRAMLDAEAVPATRHQQQHQHHPR